MFSLNLSLICCLVLMATLFITIAICQIDSNKRVMVDLDALPEVFTNQELPDDTNRQLNKTQKGVKCDDSFGCYKTIPILPSPGPMDCKTTFKIMSGGSESNVTVAPYENCLVRSPNDCRKYPFDLEKLNNLSFRPDKRTIIIICGFRSKVKAQWVTNIAELWQKLDDVNIILVGWETSNGSPIYLPAVASTRPVARQLTVLLYYLAKLKGKSPHLGLNDDAYLDKFYLIGHSLGAHLAGFVGSDLAGKIGRITGLDPAGPTFDRLEREYRIDESDARFVDILHTTGSGTAKFQFGSVLDSGHIDIWANNGQHQPGCTNQIGVCSHKRATHYYESFLKDVLEMRNNLGDSYKPLYRLRAYRSETFEDFHQGKSLIKYCRVATLDDRDLSYADLAQCSIPFDFVSWYSDYRNELETSHGLNFNETITTSTPNKFYFYTGSSDDQLDHYMVRVRVTKLTSVQGKDGKTQESANNQTAKECAITAQILMASGSLTGSTKIVINNYHLLEFADHYEIVFPFLAPSRSTKLEISKLDTEDFYVRAKDKEFIPQQSMAALQKALDEIFPSSMVLNGFEMKKKKSTMEKISSFIKPIKNFFMGKSSKEEDGEDTASENVDCKLPIESFVVQPLRKFSRHVSAFYGRQCPSSNRPEINVVLVGKSQEEPLRELLFNESRCDDQYNTDETLELSLETVIIGPLIELGRYEDGDPVLERDFELDADSSAENYIVQSEDTPDDKQDLKGGELWLVLSIMLVILIVLMACVSFFKLRPLIYEKIARRNRTKDVANSNPAYVFD